MSGLRAFSDRFVPDPPEILLPDRYIDWLPGTLPRGWTADVPHIRLIADELTAISNGENDALIIELPPRHSKTETTTVRFPVFEIEKRRDTRILVSSHTQAFANKLGRKCRNIAKRRFAMSKDRNAMGEWETPEGGGMMFQGVGSPPTGSGFDGIINDDWIKTREQADSLVYRDKLWDSWTDDFSTRREPGAWTIWIMTRWHEDDPIGRLLNSSEGNRYRRVRLPALAEANDPLGREEGEALWPVRFSRETLLRIKAGMAKKDGDRSFEALYQQNPTPKAGTFFIVDRLEILNALPAEVRFGGWRAWDLASSPDGAYTVGVHMVGPDRNGLFWVVDVRRERLTTDARDLMIKNTAVSDGVLVHIWGPQDPGSAGVDVARKFKRMLAGFTVKTEKVTGSKESRADPFSSQVNAGNVRLLKGAWNHEYKEELRQFPGGTFKDQVDASSDAFRKLTRADSGSSSEGG